ncbi:hypothetical protein L6R52_23705 [Myxococcota bacterium]|nr:hypothetical protein [Myxococcota bacterium]
MSRELQVRAVREALWLDSTKGAAERSTSLLGALFHEVASALTTPSSPIHVVALLHDAPPSGAAREEALLRAVWSRVVGPRLSALVAQLGSTSAEVLSFWTGVSELVRWLARLTDVAVEGGTPIDQVRELFASEEPVRVVLRSERWTDAVEVSGVLDLVIRVPGDQWCLVELKLGRGALEADLGQASLYHLLLRELGHPPGSLALVRFTPERSEHVLDDDALTRVRAPLLELVGRLAGVLPAPAKSGPEEAAKRPEIAGTAAAAELGKRLSAAYREYGVELKLGAPILGPAFIRFPVELGRAQLVARLSQNAPNVQVRLGLGAPPLVSVERGRLVLDVERADRQLVPFASVRGQITAAERPARGELLPIGVDHAGKMRFANLGDALNCHLLVAGTTGSGKSEWLRFALAGLALRATPEEVRFLLIDPKRNAFSELRGSPYLWGDRGIIHPDEHSVVEVLAEVVEEMEARYRLFAEASADDLAGYQEKSGRKLPRILVVCDEYYDLVAAGGREQKAIESQIGRLGAKARAAGIHLLLATQQPSRQIIRGTIDTNIPCRVGLKTAKEIESKMLLQTSGAENLLGHGDLLFKDVADPIRLQAPLTTPDERARIFRAPQ